MIPFLVALALDSSSCRFLEAPLDMLAVRTVPPAPQPPSRIVTDACLGVKRTLLAENLSTLSGGHATWEGLQVRFEVALDPLFVTTFIDETITLDPVTVEIPATFDGLVDFLGPSGAREIVQEARFVQVTFDDVADPDYFTKPFPTFCRAVIVGGTGCEANGNIHTISLPVGAGGVVFDWEPKP